MHELLHGLVELSRMRGMEQTLERISAQAEAEAPPLAEVLRRLLEEGCRHRQERSLVDRLCQAKLLWNLSLESFPFAQ